jgi:pimeloyl-ACP methyl ester carboxylesterase
MAVLVILSDQGPLDYEEKGLGPTILFVPGSCSTGAAWRPVIASLQGSYRTATTSLPGYGGSAERRSSNDQSILPLATALEEVIRHAGGKVHLVGHSFGGEVALAVALRGQVRVESLCIFEAPAPGMLATFKRTDRYREFRVMTEAYFGSFDSGNSEAIASMVDFYGGSGTFESWPPAVRRYAAETTPTNILDWASAYAFQPTRDQLNRLTTPVLVATGQNSHPAVIEANELIATAIPGAKFTTVAGANHFMISTHARLVANLIDWHVSTTSKE